MARITDDPIADFLDHDARQQRRLKTMPRCSCCGDYIQQEDAVRVRGRWFCDDCLDENRTTIGGD